jgi:hypothetical protein
MLQIVGIIAIIGLIAVLIVMRKKDAAGSTKTKSATRIGVVDALVADDRADRSDSEFPG